MLAAIAVYSFVLPEKLGQIEKRSESSESHQKYEMFVADVLNGKAQGTPDQYVHAMQVQQIIIKSERNNSAAVLNSLRDLGWGAIYGIIFQLVAIYYINRRLRNQ